MNLMVRRDRVLLAGLALAMVVGFAPPIRHLFDIARSAEQASGFALVPSLIILSGVFLLHQQGKRQESKARAAAAEAETVAAIARTAEMERLVNFGQALGRSLDLDAIRDVVAEHLPCLSGARDAWVLLRVGGDWLALAGAASEPRPDVERQRARIADHAVVSDASWATNTIEIDAHLCLPLVAGGYPVGVLGIPDSGAAFTPARQRVLAMAAALLASSVRNTQLFLEIRETSLRDGLTGCFNRTHALDVIDTELQRARRSPMQVSLIIFDIDHFKEVNDRYGHLCGDAVLATVGARMRDVLRATDLKCRYGGEEFLVLLPETPLDGARRVADALRRELADVAIPWKDGVVHITASFGVSVARPAEVDCHALIDRADAALYCAKDEGRNCVRLALETADV
jgi:diguanylate cyclase (GGDEF)-like protein